MPLLAFMLRAKSRAAALAALAENGAVDSRVGRVVDEPDPVIRAKGLLFQSRWNCGNFDLPAGVKGSRWDSKFEKVVDT